MINSYSSISKDSSVTVALIEEVNNTGFSSASGLTLEVIGSDEALFIFSMKGGAFGRLHRKASFGSFSVIFVDKDS